MLSPHPNAKLEYWFFKVNAGSIAMGVEWIARRDQDELWIRASIHSPYRREVLFQRLAASSSAPFALTSSSTKGTVGEINWDLQIAAPDKWISPDIFPAAALRMTDLTLVSNPMATFTGQISHGPENAILRKTPGLLSQYWGRCLAPEWLWVSANQFDKADVGVECSVFRTGLWGIPARIPLAYLYLRHSMRDTLAMSPPSSVRVEGSPDEFTITFRRFRGQTITLTARARDYGDFGDRIINTLVGDLEIRDGPTLIASSKGTATIERRLPA